MMQFKTRFIIISLIIGLFLIGLWIYQLDFSQFYQRLERLKANYVLYAILFYVGAYFIRSIRWKILLQSQICLTIKESWLVSCAGNWINYLIPLRIGELTKAVIIKKLKKRSAISILPSIFIDKFFDTIGIFLVLIMIPFMDIKLSVGLRVLLLILILFFTIILLILFLSVNKKDKVINSIQVILFWLPTKLKIKIYHLIDMFINGLNIFEHHYSVFLYSIFLTLLGIIFDGIYFYLMFLAFGIKIYFGIVLFGYTLINLSYALPQPPAQLGSNEWMMLIIFSSGFNLTKNEASVIMAFAHILTALIITGFGIIGFSYAGIHSLKQIEKEVN